MNEGIIYLACPYSEGVTFPPSSKEKQLMRLRAWKATYVAGQLIKRGHIVFSPLTHNQPLENMFDLPTTWDFWCRFDSAFLENCSALYVLRVDGWETSTGVQDEIRIADGRGIPISYLDWSEFSPGDM